MSTANPIVDADFTLLKMHMTKASIRGPRRYHCDLASLCHVTEALSAPSNTGWVHDISSGGIGLSYFRDLPSATTLTIRLKKVDQSGAITIGATVAHSTAEVGGTWRIGCIFERALSEQELDSCL